MLNRRKNKIKGQAGMASDYIDRLSTEVRLTHEELKPSSTLPISLTICSTYAIITQPVMVLHSKLSLVLVGLILLSATGFGEDKPWREIRSPHFRVLTNGSEKDARHIAGGFEQMRNLFASRFPGFLVDSHAPLLILAPEDEATTKKLLPQYWLHSGPKPAGVYFHGWEKQYAIVRLDAIGSDSSNADAFHVIYHEYVHSLLHTNFRWLPTWLDEGLAEFYGYTRFEGSHTYIGAPPRRAGGLAMLDRRSPIPLAKFLDQIGSFSRNDDDTTLFYAQSWAMTHFLIMGPGMDGGDRLKRFFNALQNGTEQKKAFQDTFGAFPDVQKAFDNYLARFAFSTGIIPTIPQAEEKSFSVRVTTVAETKAELASFFATTHQWKEAREYSEAALKDDPKFALGHEDMGFVNLQEGKDAEAGREFSQAVELDSQLYRSLFAKTMLSPLSRATAQADREIFRAELMKVVNIDPQFAAAFVELAKLSVAQTEMPKALALARTAERLEPSRAGYHLLTGQILLRTGHPADAASHATYVASRWAGPDRDEALELLRRVPEAQRSADPPLDKPAIESLSAEGTVKSVSCAEHAFTLNMNQAGQSLTFHMQGFKGGFSDTLWFGSDHYTPCFHMAGLRAVVRYKPAADKSYTGDALNVGFRDDLPPVENPGTVAAQ